MIDNPKIEFVRYLDIDGQCTQPLPNFASDPKILLEFYRQIVLTRAFDAKAVALQRTGQLGTFPSSLGQESVFVGIGCAMEKDDVHAPFYRDQGTFFQRGIRPRDIFAYWGGDERGSYYPENSQDFPICVPIATQTLHATGAAYAIQLRNEKRAVLTTLGDGGSSKGDFYEAMNFAGSRKLPVVFVIINNQWAISVPLTLQTAAKTLAQKSIAAGIPGIQVDGNDIIAVYDTVTKALKKARRGEGPSVIEAITYRLCDHTTADDAKRYIPNEALEQAWKKEPIKRLQSYLKQQNCINDKDIETIANECKTLAESEAKAYLNMEIQPRTAMFNYLYDQLPIALQEQYKEIEN